MQNRDGGDLKDSQAGRSPILRSDRTQVECFDLNSEKNAGAIKYLFVNIISIEGH